MIDWEARRLFIEQEAERSIQGTASALPDGYDIGRAYLFTDEGVRLDALKTAALFWELLFNS